MIENPGVFSWYWICIDKGEIRVGKSRQPGRYEVSPCCLPI